MQPIVIYPLPKFAVSEFFSVDVAQAGLAVGSTRGLCYFDREGRQNETLCNKD
jgi:hypothetical protein